jgi:hypothetical protein
MGMSRRHFDSTENVELRAKIDEAKRRLPLPELMRRLGHDEKYIGKTALCVLSTQTNTHRFQCSRARTAGSTNVLSVVRPGMKSLSW